MRINASTCITDAEFKRSVRDRNTFLSIISGKKNTPRSKQQGLAIEIVCNSKCAVYCDIVAMSRTPPRVDGLGRPRARNNVAANVRNDSRSNAVHTSLGGMATGAVLVRRYDGGRVNTETCTAFDDAENKRVTKLFTGLVSFNL